MKLKRNNIQLGTSEKKEKQSSTKSSCRAKLQQKAIKIINFLPLNDAVEKQMYEVNILKLRDFIMLQNILFVKDCLSENSPGSFNDKFHPSKLPLNHTTRSSSTYGLKVNNFKTERYGRKSIVKRLKMKCKYFLFSFFSCPFSLSSSSLIFLFFFTWSVIFLSCILLKD